MNEALIRNWNARVGPGDTVIHVGDFCCKGAERGIGGLRTKAEEWEQLLNGKIIFIRGNHDKNNGLKFALDSATIVIGKKLALIRHRPIEIKKEVPVHVDFVICGHVHQKWRTKSIDGILNINVGVDANKFYPIRNDELVGLYSANSEERA
jgi:calcineurin-like phosphoesterase family protein